MIFVVFLDELLWCSMINILLIMIYRFIFFLDGFLQCQEDGQHTIGINIIFLRLKFFLIFNSSKSIISILLVLVFLFLITVSLLAIIFRFFLNAFLSRKEWRTSFIYVLLIFNYLFLVGSLFIIFRFIFFLYGFLWGNDWSMFY